MNKIEVIPILIGRTHEIIKTEGKPTLVKNLASSVTLIKGEKNIIVDTGNVGQDEKILQKLKENGLEAKDIHVIINTHHHFDHTSNNHLFENARKIISHYEWLPNGDCLNWKIGAGVIYEREIIPGVSTILTPGHAFDHISVVVKNEKTIIIAGDAIRQNYLEGKPVPSHYHMREEYVESMKKILKIADQIIPGHGKIITKEAIREYRKKWGI